MSGRLSVTLTRLGDYLSDENKTFTIAIIASVFLWWPVVVPLDFDLVTPMTDEQASGIRESPAYQQAVAAVAYVTLPTLVDSLFDLSVMAMERLGAGESVKRPRSGDTNVSSVEVSDMAKVKTTRLTAFERLVFLVGVALPSIVVLGSPSTLSNSHFNMFYYVANNVRDLLVFAPILVFLQRSTTSWTPLYVFTIVVLLITALFVGQFQYLYADSSPPANLLNTVGVVLAVVAVLMFISNCVYCLHRSTNLFLFFPSCSAQGSNKLNSQSGHGAKDSSSGPGDNRRAGVSYQPTMKTQSFMYRFSLKSGPADSGKPVAKEGGDEELEEDHIQRKIQAIDSFYENYVPAAHMSSGLLLALAVLLPYIVRSNVEAVKATTGFIILLLVVIVVFIENRVRHNEVERTMLRMVSSVKKSYVRYLRCALVPPGNTSCVGGEPHIQARQPRLSLRAVPQVPLPCLDDAS